MQRLAVVAFFVIGITTSSVASAAAGAAIRWQDWSDGVFAQAQRENRFVLLDLGAVWCHWCHVMEETTYEDPEVVRLVGARYLPVRVDQDARPDLSNRYEDYGWPATVIFAADGAELVKFQGYIPPRRMAALLQGVIDDPTPGPSVTAPKKPSFAAAPAAALPAELRGELEQLLASRYDDEHGGWGFTHKFLDWDAVEYCLARAGAGDAQAERMARETLAQQLQLIDPVWGGAYQYSDSGDWEHPHFEKIMQMQAENLRLYALACTRWREPSHLQAARDIERFLAGFLTSPEGVFYTSMDADVVRGEHSGEYFKLPDAERRKRGLPRVDTHRYARENAWAANGLLALYAVTGEQRLLDRAIGVARWLVSERALPGGGLRHDARDAAGPYLGDSAAAGRFLLGLYAATADRAWLGRARDAADFIERTFRAPDMAGYVTAVASGALPALPQRDENVLVARFTNLLFHYTGETRYRAMAEQALRHLAIPEVARRFQTGGVLLAATELASEPVHLTVVGHADDPAARALLVAALADPRAYKRVELWDKRAGPLPRADVTYPELKRAAAFLCTEGRCSPPAYTPEELRARIARTSGGS